MRHLLHKHHTLFFFIAFNLLGATFVHAMENNTNLDKIFKKADVNATFVLYDLQTKTTLIYNESRSKKRYVPASTFKIANSLIGLDTGAINSVDEKLPYIGPDNPFIPAWKHDMGLKDAIALSNKYIYQELSRRIGLKNMQEYVKKFHYGNEDIGKQVDHFWLDGPLKISALEQVLFLKKLVKEELPVSKKIQQDVKEIILLEDDNDYKLYGKTGWYNAPNRGIGWFVGWLENPQGTYIFAFNMDMSKISDAQKRIDLSKASLTSLGLLHSK